MDPNIAGIVHNGGLENGSLIHLPLEDVRVQARIVDISAQVTLSQTYSNPDSHPTSQAVYCFPVPERAAVCAFELKTGDGRVIRGECKEKDVAKEEYEKAVASGQTAGLVQWVTDDIFRISVGSIPAGETVVAKLVFVMNLMNEDNVDHVRMQLPMHIGERYGPIMEGMIGASAPSAKTRIRMKVDIQTSGMIHGVQSPSHPGQLVVTKLPTHVGRESRRRWTVSHKSKTFLEKDFVIIVHADDLDAPRCFAELDAHPETGRRATLALQFTVVPNFKLPPVTSQEYIFVVDRSGSMDGDRVETSKATVNMLLRMLPKEKTTFNIFSFGNHCDSLWPSSADYSEFSLHHSSQQVDSMSANYGGTEIFQAMNIVLRSRNGARPTAIFLMTDGQVEGSQAVNTINEVRTAVDKAPERAPIRVYVLGIGDGVSHATCQDIADAGRGACLFATTAEEIVGKCARLLHAGRTPVLKNVSVDWGIPPQQLSANPPTVAFSASTDADTGLRLRSSPIVQQVPTTIHDIHAGMRFVVFAIIKLKGMYVPKQVKLRATAEGIIDGDNHVIEVQIPIRAVQLHDAEPGSPQLHTLAAWHLIHEHRNRLAPLPLAIDPAATEDQIRKAIIIRLGVRYQVASEHASFVAVDLNQRDDRRSRRSRRTFGASSGRDGGDSDGISWTTSLKNSIVSLASSIVPVRRQQPVPGAWPDSPTHSRSSSPASVVSDGESIYTHSTMSSLESTSSYWSEWSEDPPRRPRLSRADRALRRAPAPLLVPGSFAPPDVQRQILQNKPPPRAVPVEALPVDRDVMQMIRLQKFDGSFNIDDVRGAIDSAGFAELQTYGLTAEEVATVVAVAFMSKRMRNQKELLDDILFKANEFLEGGGKRYQSIVERAKELVV